MNKLRELMLNILSEDCRQPRGCLLDHDEAINQLLSLFQKTMMEVIGEDEELLPKDLKKIKQFNLVEHFVRNKFRKEQRARCTELMK